MLLWSCITSCHQTCHLTSHFLGNLWCESLEQHRSYFLLLCNSISNILFSGSSPLRHTFSCRAFIKLLFHVKDVFFSKQQPDPDFSFLSKPDGMDPMVCSFLRKIVVNLLCIPCFPKSNNILSITSYLSVCLLILFFIVICTF